MTRETVKWQSVVVYADEVAALEYDMEFRGNVFLSAPNADGVRSRIDPDSVTAAEIVREADGE